ncbi:MAG: hypothetical protein JSS29_09470 [Proteobacteria bacterium]|nr:hypothetical protein [Pseudomonadota bacterium]
MKVRMPVLGRLLGLAALLVLPRLESAPLEFEVEARPTSSVRWHAITARAESALRRYAAECEAGAPALGHLFTSSAVIEYPTDRAGRFDSFSAIGGGHCWSGISGPAPGDRPRMHLYPATDSEAMFIEYPVRRDGNWSCGVAFLEMRGDRISRIRDLTAVP